MSYSYKNIVRQSQKKNNRSDHKRTTKTQHIPIQKRSSDSIRPISSLRRTHSAYHTTNGSIHHSATQLNPTKNNTKSPYPMWGNSACSISPRNGIRPTKPTHHNHLHSLQQTLHITIQRMHPQLNAKAITDLIMKKSDAAEIQRLLTNTSHLQCRVANAISVLPHNKAQLTNNVQGRPVIRPCRKASSTNSHKTHHKTKPIRHDRIKGRAFAPSPASQPKPKSYKCVSSKRTPHATKTKTATLSVVNHIHTPNQQATKPKRRTYFKKKTLSFNDNDSNYNATPFNNTLMEDADDEAEYDGLPSSCTIQVLRVVVDIMIPKQIFELLLETLCIKRANSAKKIFVRCHKSIYDHKQCPVRPTVIYIHFVNFAEAEYQENRDKYFDFVDAKGKLIGWYRDRNGNGYGTHYQCNRKRKQKRKRNIFDIMGNQLGLIRVQSVKEYPPWRDHLYNLSRIVNICWRCQVNKASARKRVCSFCAEDEREDRKKITEYYRNPSNNAMHKSLIAIRKDLMQLKIALHVIPLTFRSECKKLESGTGCNSRHCSFVHDADERTFGSQLYQIRQDAIQRRSAAHGGFDYRSVKLQLWYRRLIGAYYNKHKRCTDAVSNIETIRQYLMDRNVKLYLIPNVYKNWCYYAKDAAYDRKCAKRVCTFIHDEPQRIFGDLLWKIKYDALQDQMDNASVCSSSVHYDDLSIDSEEVKAIDPTDKWWRDTINPYLDANDEEFRAEEERMEQWRMDAADIRITSQVIRYEDTDEKENDGALKHSLFVEFEGDPAAKIRAMRTYVNFTFKCWYTIDFEVVYEQEELRYDLLSCDLIQQFMDECDSMADWLKIQKEKHHRRAYQRLQSRLQITDIIASFAVTPDKNNAQCAACYFGLCDGVTHRLLRKNDDMRLGRRCCDDNLEKERKHKFDTRKCDILRGMVVHEERRHHTKSDAASTLRYKALINRASTNEDAYLKFLIIGSNAFNPNKRQHRFKDVMVRYPCNTHQFREIKTRLELLTLEKNEAYRAREHAITQIIFGFKDRKPRNIYNGIRMTKAQIGQLFCGTHALNDSQIDAVYGSIHNNLHTFQGPPGTGKTATAKHIAYLWWRLPSKQPCKIHGMAPTNQGALLLAEECDGMNQVMQDIVVYYHKIVVNWFIRPYCDSMHIPSTIRTLLLQFYCENDDQKKKFKVLFFASKTYASILENKNISQKQKDREHKAGTMTQLERVCVNVAAQYHVRKLPRYDSMSDKDRIRWMSQYIKDELRSADMICTTFGNSCHRLMKEYYGSFTHAIADECNQSSLDTLLGIIGYPKLKHLSMAGDIRQLGPVSLSPNALCHTSMYENIIRYLTSSTFDPNEYYTRLNKQYRSPPQIYRITNLFYDGTITTHKPACVGSKRRDYSRVFSGNNRIQFHLLTNTEKRLDSGSSQSKYNVMEARIAVQYIKRFILELHCREKEIAVISDYTAQIDCVYAHLMRIKGINPNKMLICTTNEIEGSSRPIVIYMCCRSNHTGNIGFLNDISRVNVATSRAEEAQIMIGDIYTLQYNPIFRQIFRYHQRYGAVVYNGDDNALQVVQPHIPLINVSLEYFLNKLKKNNTSGKPKQQEYYVCGGCDRSIHCKIFCGRIVSAPPMLIYICQKCIHRYLRRWCEPSIKAQFESELKAISPMTVVHQSDLNGSDSFGIDLEFDLLLARYLVKEGLTNFTTDYNHSNRELHCKFIDIARQMVHDIKSTNHKHWAQHVPECFQTLAKFDYTRDEDIRGDPVRSRAIGIMECRRNHLLRQAIMDARFFRLVYQIKNCPNGGALQQFYKKNKLKFYTYRKFQEHPPTLVVTAYLKACGYSSNKANSVPSKVSNLLVKKNKDKASRNTPDLRLDEAEIRSLAQYLKLDELNGIHNVLLSTKSDTNGLNGAYVIKLVQNAVIDDRMSSYHHQRTHTNALKKEKHFGDLLRSAGFDFYSEKQLQELGYKDTPDYALKKPWIVQYGDHKYEITWMDFKNTYLSATEWVWDSHRFQASRYNKTFGPGAFVFSLGFVKPTCANLQLNSHGMLAALPFTKDTIVKFLQQTEQYKSIISNK